MIHATLPAMPHTQPILSALPKIAATRPSHWHHASLGSWSLNNSTYHLPVLHWRDPSRPADFKLGLFAGIHGDEPAGVLALLDFARSLTTHPEWAAGYELLLYPLLNPTGFEDGTRHSRSGRDLNREFWRSTREIEVQLLERAILRENFHGLIALHSDDTSTGFYGFARGATLTRHLLRPALDSAAQALPVNSSTLIDGFTATQGIIHSAYEGILAAPPESEPSPFEIILESPSHAPMHLQRQGFVLSLREILTRYRQMMAYGGEL